MLESDDSVQGELKITNLPDLACFESFEELLLALPTYLRVYVPVSITNVVIGNTEPDDTQRNFLWIKRNNAGNVVGFYLFSNGAWNQFIPTPGEITTVVGASNAPPVGYITTDDATTLTAQQKAFFKGQWRDSGLGYYDVFTVVPGGQ